MILFLSSAVMTASNGGDGIPITLGEPYQNLADNATYSLATSSGSFSMPVNGRIQYNGNMTSVPCIVSAKFSLRRDEGVLLGAALYKNGLQIAETIILDPIEPTILNYPITMDKDDYIELWGNALYGDSLILVQCQLSVFNVSLL